MKKILITLSIFLSCFTHALEIQCDTNVQDIDVVIKTSPDTGITYLLFLKESTVTPVPMDKTDLNITSQGINFADETLSLSLSRSLKKGVIHLEDQDVDLFDCVEY